jgi:hypothetical protein
MKMQHDSVPPSITSGNLSPVNMGISDNAEDQLMILNVLSNSLYTDKISAVLREYGCNAFDANVEAGRGDKPIDVYLPNKLEPTLRIRDYGYGMNEEQIASVFCKLGRSTTRASNAFTGMLGIGSKAGFAYGDSFMVTSWADGKKIIYNAFRDQGVPRLAKMSEAKASPGEEGIEVKVPVRISDIPEFITKAERVFRYFKVRPNIHGQKLDFQKHEPRFKGTGWRYTGTGKSFALMGNVGYDLALSGMGLSEYSGGATATLIAAGVELDFAIGDLEIAANREGLQYKDQTKKAITDRLKVATDEIGKIFTQEIAKAPSLWEAHRLYGEAFEKMGGQDMRTLRQLVDGQIVWNGIKINTGRFAVENVEKDPEVNVWMAERHSYYARIQKIANPHACYANENVTLVINDLPSKKNSPSRVKGFFEAPANKDKTQLVIFTFQTAAAQKRYWTARKLAGAPTVPLSSLPQSLTAKTVSSGNNAHRSKHSASCFVLDEAYTGDRYNSVARSLWWAREEVDLAKDTGCYVTLDAFYVKMPQTAPLNTIGHPQEFLAKVKRLRAAGLINGKVYGFKGDRVLKIKLTHAANWQPLQDHVAKNLAAKFKAQHADQELADYLHAINHSILFDEQHYSKLRLPSGCALDKLMAAMTKAKSPKSSRKLLDLINSDDAAPWLKKPAVPKPSISLDQLEKDVLQRYPMIQLVQIGQGRNFTRGMTDKQMLVVADYVRDLEAA